MARTLLVVAHADDETAGAGGQLALFDDLTLIHVTDGAPRDMQDARRLGFANAESYAAAREAELTAALAMARVRPQRIRLEIPDQEAAANIPGIARALKSFPADLIITHAYEGGHPDHDAVAAAVQTAFADTSARVLEFPLYHLGADGRELRQRFHDGRDELVLPLPRGMQSLKRAMLNCFTTQRPMLDAFSARVERFRRARPDLRSLPNGGRLLYERHDWHMSGERFLDQLSCVW